MEDEAFFVPKEAKSNVNKNTKQTEFDFKNNNYSTNCLNEINYLNKLKIKIVSGDIFVNDVKYSYEEFLRVFVNDRNNRVLNNKETEKIKEWKSDQDWFEKWDVNEGVKGVAAITDKPEDPSIAYDLEQSFASKYASYLEARRYMLECKAELNEQYSFMGIDPIE